MKLIMYAQSLEKSREETFELHTDFQTLFQKLASGLSKVKKHLRNLKGFLQKYLYCFFLALLMKLFNFSKAKSP